MKNGIMALALIANWFVASAQTMEHSKWEESSNNENKSRNDNGFSSAEITEYKRIVTFYDLPVLPKPIYAVVTDPYGVIMTQKKVSPRCNTLRIRSLPGDALYYVTLMYKDRGQKAFVLDLK